MSVNRRKFLLWSGMAVLSVPLLKKLPLLPAAVAADLPEAKETDAMPKSLKYCVNPDKSTATCADRKKPERKTQYCRNCQLYTKISGDGEKEIGKCMILPKNSVRGSAWCMSWVKKP